MWFIPINIIGITCPHLNICISFINRQPTLLWCQVGCLSKIDISHLFTVSYVGKHFIGLLIKISQYCGVAGDPNLQLGRLLIQFSSI